MLRFAIILAAVAVCNVQAMSFRLFTRAAKTDVINMTSTDEDLPDAFNPQDNTIILIHGLGGSATSVFNTLIRDEIFKFDDQHNVIVVDWAEEAGQSYSVAVTYVLSTVSRDLVNFLKWLTTHMPKTEPEEILPEDNLPEDILRKKTFTVAGEILEPIVDLNKLHLVGFGLGAHLAGIASRRLSASDKEIGRITGLDPSGSGWGSNSQRLKENDASYVEVIHTDGSGLLANGIGTAIGAANFYANGGSNQPGCFTHSCSHNRAYELFAASLRGHLKGRACSSITQMNLNLCRGRELDMGGTCNGTCNKQSYSKIYRINTGRNFPF